MKVKQHIFSRGSYRRMRTNRKLCFILVVLVPLSFFCFHVLTKSDKVVAVWNREAPENILDNSVLQPVDKYAHISLKWKEEVLELLPRNSCKCEAKATLDIPFRQELFGKPYAINFTSAVNPSLFEDTYRRREVEYSNFKMRSYNPADKFIVAEANSPLQYPVQGLEVRPLKTILITGLSLLDLNKKNFYEVSLSGTIGTFNVAAEVDGVTIKGASEKKITLSSHLLDNLNRQLQLISYTNTIFHPNTADIVEFQTIGHSALFTIKVRHPMVPKLFDTGNSKCLPQGSLPALDGALCDCPLRSVHLSSRGVVSPIAKCYMASATISRTSMCKHVFCVGSL